MLLGRRHTKAGRRGGVETAAECHSKTSFFCAKAGVFDIHLLMHACMQAQEEMCLIERVIVSVCTFNTLRMFLMSSLC